MEAVLGLASWKSRLAWFGLSCHSITVCNHLGQHVHQSMIITIMLPLAKLPGFHFELHLSKFPKTHPIRSKMRGWNLDLCNCMIWMILVCLGGRQGKGPKRPSNEGGDGVVAHYICTNHSSKVTSDNSLVQLVPLYLWILYSTSIFNGFCSRKLCVIIRS